MAEQRDVLQLLQLLQLQRLKLRLNPRQWTRPSNVVYGMSVSLLTAVALSPANTRATHCARSSSSWRFLLAIDGWLTESRMEKIFECGGPVRYGVVVGLTIRNTAISSQSAGSCHVVACRQVDAYRNPREDTCLQCITEQSVFHDRVIP
ncbi:hypothetical protein PF010_g27526 [Phytophthora fragariae]|uniref:Uncharacterized protein n=1 Tax=Phytophthora fragariae TaxID=53985 RepID=A0A6G0MMR5_9STRA|nr:hypothetical protein PF010_g27526 [Phytophthora fragariae]KAE9173325.1 hypothetical protein PF004_g27005 [Phytophthora fragariae]